MNATFLWHGRAHHGKELNRLVQAEILADGGVVEGVIVDIETGARLGSFPSPFLTALVLTEAESSGVTLPEAVLERAIAVVRDAGTSRTGWQFFLDGRGYPPDADDTAILADFLLRHKTLGVSGCADAVALLKANRRGDGGYHVWLADETGKRKADLHDAVVDVNVAGFLDAAGAATEYSRKSFEQATRGFPQASKYYDDAVVAAWLTSRWDERGGSQAQSPGRVQRRMGFQRAAHDLLETGVHIGLLLSAARVYLAPGQQMALWARLESIDLDSPTKPWLFRHLGRSVGYSCPVLNLACAARAVHENVLRT